MTNDEREASLPADVYNRLMAHLMAGGREGLLLAGEVQSLTGASALSRRPVQAEPTPARFAARQGGKAQSTIDALLAQANERGIRVEVVYPQDEPSDAQVLAALNAYDTRFPGEDLDDYQENEIADMRNALRAAFKTPDQEQ